MARRLRVRGSVPEEKQSELKAYLKASPNCKGCLQADPEVYCQGEFVGYRALSNAYQELLLQNKVLRDTTLGLTRQVEYNASMREDSESQYEDNIIALESQLASGGKFLRVQRILIVILTILVAFDAAKLLTG